MRRSLLGLALVALAGALTACASAGSGSADPDGELRIVSYNIRHGRGMDDSVDLARTARALHTLAPDVVGLQEVDDRVRRSGGVDQAAALGGMLGMEHAFGAFMEYQGGHYGLAILSRLPIVRAIPVRLPDGNEPRVALVAELRLPDGRRVAAVNVHFDWVDDDGFRFAQARALASVLDTLSLPHILLGDFNDLPGSRTLALFRQRAAELAKPSEDHFTFSSTSPEREIDFIFVSPASAWSAGAARAITEPVASDHRPVLATVRLRR